LHLMIAVMALLWIASGIFWSANRHLESHSSKFS
jgi:hypothetical protein